MDSDFVAMVLNMGFAVGVATYLVKYVTAKMDDQLAKILELQERIMEIQNDIKHLLEYIIKEVERR